MEKKIDRFFGEITTTSNKYFTFKKYINDDEILLVTSNIHEIKGNLIMIIADNKAVYLKDWQVRPVMNYYEDLYTFVVKLNRNFFKPYTFSTPFDAVAFGDREDTFDDLVQGAKEQDKRNIPFRKGWQKNQDIEYNINRRTFS